MPAKITTTPDKEDLLEALSDYYFPDRSTAFEDVHIKYVKRGPDGDETVILPVDQCVIQFTGTQTPSRVDLSGVPVRFEDDFDLDDPDEADADADDQ